MNKDSKEMAKLACKALDDKKALDIKVIDIHEVSVMADYFIIASGSNQNQVQAMMDNVDETLGRAGYEMKHSEKNSILCATEARALESLSILNVPVLMETSP